MIVVAAVVLMQALVASGDGQRTYQLNCVQCHGSDGDSLGYADILPISGIHRRHSADMIGRLTGAFSGRVFYGKDRDDLVRYIGTLPGSKGYPDPGWLISPYLLERKAPRIHEFRVLDARSKQAYESGHITNALSVNPATCIEDIALTAQWLGKVGVTPQTAVVIYDTNSGTAAACVWWRIRRAGHQFVAVLDGGWDRWIAEQRAIATVVPRIAPAMYEAKPQHDPPSKAVRIKDWSWRDALNNQGFRPYAELVDLVKRAGIESGVRPQFDGPQDQLAHLILVLHLLGYSGD